MGKRKAKDKAQAAPNVGDKPFLHIHLRAFSHATEDLGRVAEAIGFAAGFSLDGDETTEDAKRFEACTSTVTTEGYFHNPITILETELKRNREIRTFWDRLLAVEGARARIAAEVDDRLDDDLVLWLRLDKQEAAQGRLALTTRDDAVQVRAKLATYPKDRDTGLAFLRDFLSAPARATTGRQTS